MRKQLTIIAAGLGLAVGGFGLFSVSASAMSASGRLPLFLKSIMSPILSVNRLSRVQYYPYGYSLRVPFLRIWLLWARLLRGAATMGAAIARGGYYGRGYGGRGYYGRGVAGRGHYGRGGVGGHGGRGHVGEAVPLTITAPSETSGGATLRRVALKQQAITCGCRLHHSGPLEVELTRRNDLS